MRLKKVLAILGCCLLAFSSTIQTFAMYEAANREILSDIFPGLLDEGMELPELKLGMELFPGVKLTQEFLDSHGLLLVDGKLMEKETMPEYGHYSSETESVNAGETEKEDGSKAQILTKDEKETEEKEREEISSGTEERLEENDLPENKLESGSESENDTTPGTEDQQDVDQTITEKIPDKQESESPEKTDIVSGGQDSSLEENENTKMPDSAVTDSDTDETETEIPVQEEASQDYKDENLTYIVDIPAQETVEEEHPEDETQENNPSEDTISDEDSSDNAEETEEKDTDSSSDPGYGITPHYNYFWDDSWFLPMDFRFTQVEKEYAIVKSDGENLPVYSSKDDESTVVGTIPYFGLVYILEENSEWTYIESGDVRGFVKTQYLKKGNFAEHVVEVLGEHAMAEGNRGASEYRH